MPWFKRNNKEVKQIVVKDPRTLLQRIMHPKIKTYEVDVLIVRVDKVLGKFPMTVKSYSKSMVKKRINEEIKVQAGNIKLIKK